MMIVTVRPLSLRRKTNYLGISIDIWISKIRLSMWFDCGTSLPLWGSGLLLRAAETLATRAAHRNPINPRSVLLN